MTRENPTPHEIDQIALNHALSAKYAEQERLAAAAEEIIWAHKRARHVFELTHLLGDQEKAAEYLGIDQSRVSRLVTKYRRNLAAAAVTIPEDPQPDDQGHDFPSLPDRDATSIRSNGLVLDGMSPDALPAIISGDLRTCTYIDGIECELTWQLGDITATQAQRLSRIFAEHAERQSTAGK